MTISKFGQPMKAMCMERNLACSSGEEKSVPRLSPVCRLHAFMLCCLSFCRASHSTDITVGIVNNLLFYENSSSRGSEIVLRITVD